jgi:hypothetical protein
MHVLDAIAAADVPSGDGPPSRDKARAFMAKVMNPDVEQRTDGGLIVTKREDEEVVSFAAEMPADAMGAAWAVRRGVPSTTRASASTELGGLVAGSPAMYR